MVLELTGLIIDAIVTCEDWSRTVEDTGLSYH